MGYQRIDVWLILLALFFISQRSAFASSDYLLLSTQNASNSPAISQQSVELFLSTESPFQNKKDLSYDIDINVSEIITPTSFLATPVTVKGSHRFISPFNTTLTTIQGIFSIDWHSKSNWQYGFSFLYSDQNGNGTPYTYSRIINFDFGKTIEYHRNAQNEKSTADLSVEKSDEFVPSYRWKITEGSGSIAANTFLITTVQFATPPYGTTSTDPLPAASLVQFTFTLDLAWDVLKWLTLEGSYEQFGYNTDPNALAPAKSPRRGSATSLESFEDLIVITFHLGDYWDLETKGVYDITATSDLTSSDEETYKLIYFGYNYELAVGYDHQNAGGLPVDSSVVDFKINF